MQFVMQILKASSIIAITVKVMIILTFWIEQRRTLHDILIPLFIVSWPSHITCSQLFVWSARSTWCLDQKLMIVETSSRKKDLQFIARRRNQVNWSRLRSMWAFLLRSYTFGVTDLREKSVVAWATLTKSP